MLFNVLRHFYNIICNLSPSPSLFFSLIRFVRSRLRLYWAWQAQEEVMPSAQHCATCSVYKECKGSSSEQSVARFLYKLVCLFPQLKVFLHCTVATTTTATPINNDVGAAWQHELPENLRFSFQCHFGDLHRI